MTPRALFIIPSDYDDLMRKGVGFMFAEREEGGFFERVITVHPSASQERQIELSPRHRLYEFREAFLPFGDRFKLLRYAHHVVHGFSLLKKITAIVENERINMIRATDPQLPGFLAWLVSLKSRVPFCVSIHADFDKRASLDAKEARTFFGSRALARRLEWFLCRRAKMVLPIRESLAEKAAQAGIPPAKIRVIPHGIDLSAYRGTGAPFLKRKLGIAGDVPMLAFAGRLSKENYVHDVTALAFSLKNKGVRFALVMAGDGPEKAALSEFIARHSLADSVYMPGFLDREHVAALRKECALSLCLMGGYSLIEACAGGRPVVAYDVEWHSDLVKNHETGFLIKEGDAAALLAAVESALSDEAAARKLGDAAKRLAFEKHDVAKTSEIKQSCYREIIG